MRLPEYDLFVEGGSVDQTQEALEEFQTFVGALGDLVKKTFSQIGKAIVENMNNAADAISGTSGALKRTVAGFDQLNRLKAPSGSSSVAQIDKEVEKARENLRLFIKALKEMDTEPVLGPIRNFVTGLWEVTTSLWDVQSPLSGFSQLFWDAAGALGITSDKVGGFVGVLGGLSVPVAAVGGGLSYLWEKLRDVGLKWDSTGTSAENAFTTMTEIWGLAGEWVQSNVSGPLGQVFSRLWGQVTEDSTKTGETVKGIWSGTASSMGSIFSQSWEQVKKAFTSGGQVFSGLESGISSQFKTVVNGLIDGINSVVSTPFQGINTALQKVSQVEILGIKPFRWLGWQIPVPKIPHLAQGAVLPANKPFLAVVGDQRHGTNVEAPLSTIQEAVAQVMAGQTDALMQGLSALIQEQQMTRQTIAAIRVGDTVIGQAAQRYEQRITRMRGGQ